MIEKITDALSNEYLVYNDGDWNSAIDRAISIVQEVAKEYGNGWIPVEERLPEDIKDVWVTVKTAEGDCFVTDAFYSVQAEKWRVVPRFEVIAWQPKQIPPAPYQKGE